jgi:SAM-dependent methyltransferase
MGQYDAVAEAYERWIVPKFRRSAERVLAAADLRPGERVLEVAAGTGGLARLVLPVLGPSGSLTVTDLSPEMVDVARRILAASPVPAARRPALRIEAADLTELPVGDASVDVVVAQMTPLLDLPAGIAEAARVLRPGGRLAALTWGSRYTERDLLDAARATAGLPPNPPATVGQARGLLRAAGFVDVRRRTSPATVLHDSVESYLAYRAAFGIPPTWTPEQRDRYQVTLEQEARRAAGPDGRVRLTWSTTLVTAVRG